MICFVEGPSREELHCLCWDLRALDKLFGLIFSAWVSARHIGCKFRRYPPTGLEFGSLKGECFPHPSPLGGQAAQLIPNQ